MAGEMAFTVDVEDGISIAMRDAFGKDVPQTDRVVTNTRKILDLLKKYETKGTFFVLGKVAEDFPFLIREIADAGHELGIHGYHHLQFFLMTPKQALQELTEAKKRVEDLIGKKVLGHRAPAFSINEKTAWGLDVIAEAGFVYDSSIMPINGTRYGWSGYPKEIRKIETPKHYSLIEAPLSTTRVLGRELPFSGGGYLRLFPFTFTRAAFKKEQEHRPVILYMHPYELDTEKYPDFYFEELNKVGLLKREKMKSYWINRKTIYPKLERLLTSFTFAPLWDIIEKEGMSMHTL